MWQRNRVFKAAFQATCQRGKKSLYAGVSTCKYGSTYRRLGDNSKLKSENGTQDANSDYISELEAKLMKLQKYKDEYDDFQKRVKEFDEKVVFTKNAPDISEYQKYYEEIQPENAEKIYKQVLLKLQYTKKAEELGKFYANMDADKAAARLSEMSEDLSLIRDILENMTEKQAAAILQEMDVDFAAQVTKKISSVKK